MNEVITINTNYQLDFEEKLEKYLNAGYELKDSSCGYYGIASDTRYEYWMAILVKQSR